MHSLHKLLPALTIAVLLCGTAFADVQFQQITFAEAQTQAQAQHKFIMVDVYTDWCYWCKVLDKQTYSAKDVGDYAGANFISVKINAEKGDGVPFAQTNGVHGYPTIIFFDADGKEVDRVVGYQPAETFLVSLQTARAGGISGLEKSAAEHPTNPGVLYTLGEKYAEKGDTARAFPYFRSVVQYDAGNSRHLAEQAAIMLATAANEAGDAAPLQKYINDYPASEGVVQAHMLLTKSYLLSGDTIHAEQHFQSLVALKPHDAGMYNNYAWSCAQAKINLMNALVYADSAIALAADKSEKASYIDTKAAVLFSQGNYKEAITTEKLALASVDHDEKNARLVSGLKNTLSKYERAAQQN